MSPLALFSTVVSVDSSCVSWGTETFIIAHSNQPVTHLHEILQEYWRRIKFCCCLTLFWIQLFPHHLQTWHLKPAFSMKTKNKLCFLFGATLPQKSDARYFCWSPLKQMLKISRQKPISFAAEITMPSPPGGGAHSEILYPGVPTRSTKTYPFGCKF